MKPIRIYVEDREFFVLETYRVDEHGASNTHNGVRLMLPPEGAVYLRITEIEDD